MSDWFIAGVWLENQEQDVHFEVTNEDGEQFFFSIAGRLLKENIKQLGGSLKDLFYYAEEDLLTLAVGLIESEYLEIEQSYSIKPTQFQKYFRS